MAASGCRTTEEAVLSIIDVDSTIDISPFIETANLLVTKHCEEANPAYTVTELEKIERYLSAHLCTMVDPRVKSESVGKLSNTYESNTDLGLDASRWGQTAKMLDWYGGLAALDQKMKKGGGANVGITWMGTVSETLEE